VGPPNPTGLVVYQAHAVARPAAPGLVAAAGPAARFAYEEFLYGQLRNPHTRAAYGRAVRRFLAWAEGAGLRLDQVTPGAVGAYFDAFGGSVPTRKLYLAALRHFFDVMVSRHVVVLNPAASVRVERYQVVEGLTPPSPAAATCPPLAGTASSPANRDPGSPPRTNPIRRCRSVRAVVRAWAAAKPASRSQNTRRSHPG